MSISQGGRALKKPEELTYQQYNQFQEFNNIMTSTEIPQVCLQHNENNELFHHSADRDSLSSYIQKPYSPGQGNHDFVRNRDTNNNPSVLNYPHFSQTNHPQQYQYTRSNEFQSPQSNLQQLYLAQSNQAWPAQVQPSQRRLYPSQSDRPQSDPDQINPSVVQFNPPQTRLTQPNQERIYLMNQSNRLQPYATQQPNQNVQLTQQSNQSRAHLTQPSAYNRSAKSYLPTQSYGQLQHYVQSQPPNEPSFDSKQLYNQSYARPPHFTDQPQPYPQTRQSDQPRAYSTQSFNLLHSNSAQQYNYQQPQSYAQSLSHPQTCSSQSSNQPQPHYQQTQPYDRVYQSGQLQLYSTPSPSYLQAQPPQSHAQNSSSRLYTQPNSFNEPQPYTQTAHSFNHQPLNQPQLYSLNQQPDQSQPHPLPSQSKPCPQFPNRPKPSPMLPSNEPQPYMQRPANPPQLHTQTQSYLQRPSDQPNYDSPQSGQSTLNPPVGQPQFRSAHSGAANQFQTQSDGKMSFPVGQSLGCQTPSDRSQKSSTQKDDCFSDELRRLKLSSAADAVEIESSGNWSRPNPTSVVSVEKAHPPQSEKLGDRVASNELTVSDIGSLPQGPGVLLGDTKQDKLHIQFTNCDRQERMCSDSNEPFGPASLPDHVKSNQNVRLYSDYTTRLESQDHLPPLKDAKNRCTESEKNTLKSLLGEGKNTTHFYSVEEVNIFTRYINFLLKDDRSLAGILPIKPNCDDLLNVTADGTLICKLINRLKPGTINNNHIILNPVSDIQRIENHRLAIFGSSKIGCKVINIDPYDILKKNAYLTIAFIWQIIRTHLFSRVSSSSYSHPELIASTRMSEDPKNLSKMKPEDILVRWFNWHLKMAGHDRQIANFGSDIADGECYLVFLAQTAPHIVPKGSHLQVRDPAKRASMVCDYMDRICGFRLLEPSDVLNGNEELNTAACATLFDCILSMSARTEGGGAESQENDQSSRGSRCDQEEAEHRLKLAEEAEIHRLELERRECSVKENLRRLEEETLRKLEEEKNRKMHLLAMQEQQMKLCQTKSEMHIKKEQEKLNQMLDQVKQFEVNLQHRRDIEKERASLVESDIHRQSELYRTRQEQERSKLDQARQSSLLECQQGPVDTNHQRYIQTLSTNYDIEKISFSVSNLDQEHHYEIPKVITTKVEKNSVTSFVNGLSWPIGRLQICIVEAKRLAKLSPLDPDPYVSVTFEGMHIKTPIAKGTLDPKWNFTFDIRKVSYHHEIVFQVLDYMFMVKDAFLGQVKLKGSDLSKFSERWYPLESRQYKLTKVQGELFIRLSVIV